MNLKIIPSTSEETKEFEEREWPKVDKEHWGGEITWETNDFRFSAKVEEKIVGLIFGKYEVGTTYVDNIIIAEEFRGQGVGTQLMNFIENWTIEQGGHKVWLVTHVEWEANKLYQKLGYQKTCILKKHFMGADFALYEKFLKEETQ